MICTLWVPAYSQWKWLTYYNVLRQRLKFWPQTRICTLFSSTHCFRATGRAFTFGKNHASAIFKSFRLWGFAEPVHSRAIRPVEQQQKSSRSNALLLWFLQTSRCRRTKSPCRQHRKLPAFCSLWLGYCPAAAESAAVAKQRWYLVSDTTVTSCYFPLLYNDASARQVVIPVFQFELLWLVLLWWQEFATRSVAVFFWHTTAVAVLVAVANIGQCQGYGC